MLLFTDHSFSWTMLYLLSQYYLKHLRLVSFLPPLILIHLSFLCSFIHLPSFISGSDTCQTARPFYIFWSFPIPLILSEKLFILPIRFLGLITPWYFTAEIGSYLETTPFIFAKSNLKTFSFCSQVKSPISTFPWISILKNFKRKKEKEKYGQSKHLSFFNLYKYEKRKFLNHNYYEVSKCNDYKANCVHYKITKLKRISIC